ncbi:uncharacterized protein LOC118644550 isoform X1 [Monomorium pharaonis]|uniref:uncharacterized protein LOC118644550 isoform X1 n=1 Tax=Monomorium pharaonis TaxID=307658 RepID=UPI0017474323|nr:uncharacterized protein LOC118644550 isoform X1 [Monomorium pharaonis]
MGDKERTDLTTVKISASTVSRIATTHASTAFESRAVNRETRHVEVKVFESSRQSRLTVLVRNRISCANYRDVHLAQHWNLLLLFPGESIAVSASTHLLAEDAVAATKVQLLCDRYQVCACITSWF